uniref:Imm8 family immunity protein n=1 Tax=Iodobacter sp. CM08 TaxID=3085902 RepID=UPI0039906144
MKPIVRSISSDLYDMDVFTPEDKSCFCLNLLIRIGMSDSSGSDNFEVLVCTAGWVSKHVWEPTWGRHMIIVRSFDFHEICEIIRCKVDSCEGIDWQEIATKISRFLA